MRTHSPEAQGSGRWAGAWARGVLGPPNASSVWAERLASGPDLDGCSGRSGSSGRRTCSCKYAEKLRAAARHGHFDPGLQRLAALRGLGFNQQPRAALMSCRKLFIRGKAGETQGGGIKEPEVEGNLQPARPTARATATRGRDGGVEVAPAALAVEDLLPLSNCSAARPKTDRRFGQGYYFKVAATDNAGLALLERLRRRSARICRHALIRDPPRGRKGNARGTQAPLRRLTN